ncbi:HAMP domain-containing methyl-accepting chemotaxis protein [Tardiphaga sp.]|uniref:methyl-accepting chemotaxis protein n=1 Tax=Tardiphaga sp. TaxID=1926292 RepID=UPI0026001DB5|nr:HAMP domain-containing methyl-accepting chemotaxis protein [Tardiphaga sp.]
MITFNRVGNKLGLAGVVGILLAGGLVINEMRTEGSINEANRHAEVQQKIADSARMVEFELGNMRFATRSVRTAITTSQVDKGNADIQAAKAAQDQSLDATIALLVQPANKERFARIKAMAGEYVASAAEIVGLQKKLLELYRTRNVAALDWDRHLEQMRATTAIVETASWAEVNVQLRNADIAINAVRAAAWRYAAMNEAPQKALITKYGSALTNALARASVVDENEMVQAGLTQLGTDMKRFMSATSEAININDLKTSITDTKAAPAGEAASSLIAAAVAAAQKSTVEARAGAADELARSGLVNRALGLAVVAVLIGTMLFSFLGVARPMTRLNGAMAKMAAGDLDLEIPGAGRGDEIGDIAKTVSVIRENAEQKARDEAAASVSRDQLAAASRKRDMVKLADDFENAVGNIVQTVSSASTQLEASAGTLTATAERTQQLTIMVAAASDEAATNVRSVASATEEMASSVDEISRQVQESSTIASAAVDQVRKTNDRVGELARAAARIGDVVELINTIAGQTNLLALNATIEAARAGDAGRGFAVVASEVKALAEQTAKATGDISQHIHGIQAATRESVGAIKEIGDTIGRMSEIASTIASAVEEQGAATREISRNVQQASSGTTQVSSNIVDVQRGAGETGSASSQVLSAAQSLSGESLRLKTEVGRFLDSVRAA